MVAYSNQLELNCCLISNQHHVQIENWMKHSERAGSNQLVSSSRDSQSKASAANHVKRRPLEQVCESGAAGFCPSA